MDDLGRYKIIDDVKIYAKSKKYFQDLSNKTNTSIV